jgi:hypothetical protein
MAKPFDETKCTPEICVEKWKAVHDKLDSMHDDFTALKLIVTNGMNDRLRRIEIERETEKKEADTRRKHWARWEAAAVFLICSGLATGVVFVGKIYFDHQNQATRHLIEQHPEHQ